jgi:hypothetical protein
MTRVAVLTLTRDRLEYTQHCFAKLHENAGCDFDHFVLDQGSTDGTGPNGSNDEYDPDYVACLSRERRHLARHEHASRLGRRVARLRRDREVRQRLRAAHPNTLRDIAALVIEHQVLLLSPEIHGFATRRPRSARCRSATDQVSEKQQIGGIFLAAPASLYEWFRYSDQNPSWGIDDAEVCARWRHDGGVCGYVDGYDANHFETTDGQHERFPGYFERVRSEGKVAA